MAVVIVMAAVGLVAWRLFPRWPSFRGPEPVSTSTAPSAAESAAVPYRNVWDRYRGPEVDSVGSAGPAVDLRYRPSDHGHFFAALWVTGMSVDGRLETGPPDAVGPYRGGPCVDNCLEIDLGVRAPAGLLALPVATGHLVDPRSVRFDGVQMPLVATGTGHQPALVLDGPRSGRLRYRSALAKAVGSAAKGTWPALPQMVADFASSLGGLSLAARAKGASDYVARHVAYDISRETMARHRRARDRSVGLFDRALTIGAGDCDVQNALVAAILDDSGVPSRLAVGWVGEGGRTRSGLHAWAEYLGADGRWRAVDASVVERPMKPVSSMSAEQGNPLQGSSSGLEEWVPAAVIFCAVLVGLLVAMIARLRWRRDFRAGDADDVAELVRGAAVRPRAFANIHSLFSRGLLRCLSGRPISLARARKLAGSGRLACGSRSGALACDAARRGGVVLDLDSTISAAAAEALAAVNLDRWSDLIDRAEANTLTIHVEERLRTAGEPCRIGVADGVGPEMVILEGSAFGLGSHARWFFVDSNCGMWRSLLRLTERQPARAALLFADIVLHRSGAASVVRQRCLSLLASEALLEAAGLT
jgi:transglutaminase-like putative cysteine protease